MNRPPEICATCPVHEEAALRAFLGGIERLPVGPVVNALRNDVYDRARRLREAPIEHLNESHDAFLQAVDRLIQEAAKSSTVERMALASEAEKAGRERQQELDESWVFAQAGAAA